MLDLTIMAAVQNGLNAVACDHEALAAARSAGLDAQSALLKAEDVKKETEAAEARAEANLLASKRKLNAAIDGAFPSPISSPADPSPL